MHLTASAHVDQLVKLTYNDFVYFNKREKLIKVTKNEFNEPGYIKTVTLRKHAAKPLEFDEMLKQMMLLNVNDIRSKESPLIWDNF